MIFGAEFGGLYLRGDRAQGGREGVNVNVNCEVGLRNDRLIWLS